MELLNTKAFQLILSSAVVAALITSAFNYLDTRNTNARLLEIENIQRQSELETYRYTNIFEAVKEINSLPSISYNYLREDEYGKMVQDKELFGQVVADTSERYSEIKNIYDRITPLVETEIAMGATMAIQEAERQSNLLTESLYSNSPLPEGVDVVTLMQARHVAENEIENAMKYQVSKLTDNLK
jgi:hypothetical protein